MTAQEVVFFANLKFGEVAYLVEDKDEYLLMTSNSKWRIIKRDFSRFHCYTLYHSNSIEGFHKQQRNPKVEFLIFDAIRHDTPSMSKVSWEEFNRLWEMFLYGREIESRVAAFEWFCD